MIGKLSTYAGKPSISFYDDQDNVCTILMHSMFVNNEKLTELADKLGIIINEKDYRNNEMAISMAKYGSGGD